MEENKTLENISDRFESDDALYAADLNLMLDALVGSVEANVADENNQLTIEIKDKTGKVIATTEVTLPSGGEVSEGILANYVKNTDFATSEKAGLVKSTGSGNGIHINSTNGDIKLVVPTDTEIINRVSGKAVILSMIDKAVQQSLSNRKITWTDEQEAAARALLGAVNIKNNKGKIVEALDYSGSSGVMIAMGFTAAGDAYGIKKADNESDFYIAGGRSSNCFLSSKFYDNIIKPAIGEPQYIGSFTTTEGSDFQWGGEPGGDYKYKKLIIYLTNFYSSSSNVTVDTGAFLSDSKVLKEDSQYPKAIIIETQGRFMCVEATCMNTGTTNKAVRLIQDKEDYYKTYQIHSFEISNCPANATIDIYGILA